MSLRGERVFLRSCRGAAENGVTTQGVVTRRRPDLNRDKNKATEDTEITEKTYELLLARSVFSVNSVAIQKRHDYGLRLFSNSVWYVASAFYAAHGGGGGARCTVVCVDSHVRREREGAEQES